MPVPRYDDGIAARVQRMFDMIGPDRALWRANLLRYDDPALFQPHTEAAPAPRRVGGSPYLRSERQDDPAPARVGGRGLHDSHHDGPGGQLGDRQQARIAGADGQASSAIIRAEAVRFSPRSIV